MKELMLEIKEIRKEQMEHLKNVKEIRKEQTECLKEIGRISAENKELKQRIGYLENKIEKTDREKRKMNIIIKGKYFPENAKAEMVQKFLEEKIGVKTKLNEIQHVGTKGKGEKTIVRATVDNLDGKRMIMKNKKKLRGSNYYIDDDLTDAEQLIQKKIREIGKTEKSKGNKIIIAYQKIKIDEEWFRWDNETGKIIKHSENEHPKNG